MREQMTLTLEAEVKRDWVDFNGHMGDYAYGIVFSDALTRFMDNIGVDAAYRAATRCTLYTLEMRIAYLKECHAGQEFSVVQQIVDHDAKRFHVYQVMLDKKTGEELAWCEQLLMYMQQSDKGPPKSAFFPENIFAKLESYAIPQKNMLKPEWVGRPMGIRRK